MLQKVEFSNFSPDPLSNIHFTASSILKNFANLQETRIHYLAEYFPYGKVLREYIPNEQERYMTTMHACPTKECSRKRDMETELDYRGARYYDSDVARFLSLDPLANKFPAWSAYNYVMGNPIMLTDPTGREPEDTDKKPEDEYELGTNKGGWTKNHQMMNEAFGDDEGFSDIIADKVGEGEGDGDKKKNTKTSGLDAVQKTGTFAGLASGGLGGLQIGMIDYRQTIPIQNRIGTFSQFSSTYSRFGTASKFLGRAGNLGAGISFYSDTKSFMTGQLSGERYAFRTTGLGLSIGVGFGVGGPPGAAAAALVGGGFSAMEIGYDAWNYMWNETSRQIGNFKTALSNGWYPGN